MINQSGNNELERQDKKRSLTPFCHLRLPLHLMNTQSRTEEHWFQGLELDHWLFLALARISSYVLKSSKSK